MDNLGILKELDQGGETLDNGEYWKYRSKIAIEPYGASNERFELKITDPRGNLVASLVMSPSDMGELFTRHRSAGTLWIRTNPHSIQAPIPNLTYIQLERLLVEVLGAKADDLTMTDIDLILKGLTK